MDLARAPCRAPLTARKKGSGYENGDKQCEHNLLTACWQTSRVEKIIIVGEKKFE